MTAVFETFYIMAFAFSIWSCIRAYIGIKVLEEDEENE